MSADGSPEAERSGAPADSAGGADTPAVSEPVVREPEWKRRRRLAEVFGSEPGETPRDGKGDAWYRDQVPPHHGD